jgi:uncharacterized protein
VEIMLLEFTVENYRSIKEPVTLSAVGQKSRKTKAGKRAIKSDEEICPGFKVEGWDLIVLPVMAIFGANASGKSNVLGALDYFALLATGTHGNIHNLQDYGLPTLSKFRLDNDYELYPTKFGIEVALNNCIFSYQFSVNGTQIIDEILDYRVSETKRSRTLFHRLWDEDKNKYIWKNGENFSGSHIQLQESIRENELFLGLMKRLNIKKINPFLDWLENWCIDFKYPSLSISNGITGFNIRDIGEKRSELEAKIFGILRNFDTGLLDVKIKEFPDSSGIQILAIHQNEKGEQISWGFDEESLGTRRLFSLAYEIVKVLGNGSIMTLDELGSNLHPKITSHIIQLFQTQKTNPNGAQLIFTSHDNTLQRNQLLRRDQIWFTEKKSDQSTDLYSLADFKVRNDLAIDKAYLDGRFGAVPFLPETVEELLGVD